MTTPQDAPQPDPGAGQPPAQPRYEQPQYPQPQYQPPQQYQSAHQHQQPPQHQPLTAGSGLPWGLGFLAYIPIPFFGQIVAGLVMAVVGSRRRSTPGIVGEQGRHAANWGYTYATLTVLCVVVAVGLGTVSNASPELRSMATAGAMTTLGIWAIGVNVAHLVCCIIGLVRAAKGRVFRCPIAIPFFGRGPASTTAVL